MARPLVPGNSALIRVKKNRVSYALPHPGALNAGHCFGVNALALDEHRNVLYSAGRDSTIKSWQLDPASNKVSVFRHRVEMMLTSAHDIWAQ
jgi:WD40 repeat protein